MSEITPALNAAEWKDRLSGGENVEPEGGPFVLDGEFCVSFDSGLCYAPVERRHAAAAVALHGQPFGFTWDDVDFLWEYSDQVTPSVAAHCQNLARRIAALLPERPMSSIPFRG